MSALVGVVGCERGPQLLSTMMPSLSHRARNGWATSDLEEASIGVGFTRMTSEEPLGAVILGDDTLKLVYDARLDDRKQLVEILDADPKVASDGDLILLAWRRWGVNFTQHLIGDFAIAIWDDVTKRLILARDHFGVKPLFYRQRERAFAFASEVQTLAKLDAPFHPITMKDISERKILDFVAAVPAQDHTIMTPCIMRVPPGHTLELKLGTQPTLEAYWEPRANFAIPPDGVAAGFRRLFDSAVQDRLRGIQPVACLLSGGLDSTSIACSAANSTASETGGRLITVSAVFDLTPEENERPFIEAALKRHRFDPHFVAFDNYAPFHGFASILRPHWRIVNSPGIRMTSTLLEAARATGAGVLLHGHGGDEVVSHGFGRLNELATARRWHDLWIEAGGVCRLYGQSRFRFVAAAFIQYGRLPGLRRLRRHLAKRKPGATKALGLQKQGAATEHSAAIEMHKMSETDRHLADLKSIRHVEALELIELSAAHAGLEPRFPFYDIRLVEFCLALPAEAKMAKGWTRFVLRKAMDGLIPKEVQWRATKFDFSVHVARGLLNHHKADIEDIIANDPNRLERYINIEYLSTQFTCLCGRSQSHKADIQAIWRALCLNEWLKSFDANSSGGR